MNTKLKKAFIGISFAALFLLGSCSQQKKANPNPVLMKNARKSPYFNAGMDRACRL